MSGLRRHPSIGTAALLAGAVFFAYLPALGAGFVWDDPNFALRTDLRSLSGLWRIWSDPAATEQYFPVLHSAFWLEGRLWGGWAAGYHAVNIALHALAAWLFVRVLRRLEVPGALFAGLVFALHPVGVESVAWIAEQKNTLSTVFYLAAALAYLRWRPQRPAVLPYLLATGLFVLAVLSKSATATLPAALLVIAWWRQGRLEWRRDAIPLAPWFVIGAASGLFTAWVERAYIGAEGGAFDLSLSQRFLVAGRAVWHYAGKLFWPRNLMFIYPRWRVDPAAGWPYLFPLALVAALAALWLWRRRRRAPLAALLLFSGTLFPTLGFLNVYGFNFSYVADHWQYLAGFGVIALAAAGWAAWRAGPHGWAAVPAAGVVLGALGALTWTQCRMYRDEETLYRTTLARNPAAWMAQANWGVLLAGRGRLEEAVAHYAAALRLNPDLPEAYNNLGNALAQLQRFREAEDSYAAALRLRPGFEAARRNLAQARYHQGNAYGNAGRFDDAIGEYGAALRLNPDYAEALANRGLAFANEGRTAEALEDLHRALAIRPDYADAHAFLGFALARSGRRSEAAAEYRAALRLNPGDAAVLGRLEEVLRQPEKEPEGR